MGQRFLLFCVLRLGHFLISYCTFLTHLSGIPGILGMSSKKHSTRHHFDQRTHTFAQNYRRTECCIFSPRKFGFWSNTHTFLLVLLQNVCFTWEVFFSMFSSRNNNISDVVESGVIKNSISLNVSNVFRYQNSKNMKTSRFSTVFGANILLYLRFALVFESDGSQARRCCRAGRRAWGKYRFAWVKQHFSWKKEQHSNGFGLPCLKMSNTSMVLASHVWKWATLHWFWASHVLNKHSNGFGFSCWKHVETCRGLDTSFLIS